MRMRVCKAVEIQAVWRGFLVRKELIRLREATVILQAHWRGKIDREKWVYLQSEEVYTCTCRVHVHVQCHVYIHCIYELRYVASHKDLKI